MSAVMAFAAKRFAFAARIRVEPPGTVPKPTFEFIKLVFKVKDKLASDAPLMGHEMELLTRKVRIGFRFEMVLTLIVETLRVPAAISVPVRAFEIRRSPAMFRVQPSGVAPTPSFPLKDTVFITRTFADVNAKTLGA
jgi:hypothetical protein